MVPPKLGNLDGLSRLHLDNNELTGPVPVEFGGLEGLVSLILSLNARLSGALSADLAALTRLEELLTVGTDLCAPSNTGFQRWLAGIRRQRVAGCAGAASTAYLAQAVQSREFPVPLVAGEEALLRVFVTARQANSASLPSVRATFYLGGAERHVVNIPAGSVPIPTEVDEGALEKSADAEIPGEIVQPGLEMVIEVDPEGTLDPALGVTKRIPDTGRIALDIRSMPLFDLTVIPFLWSKAPDSSILDLTCALAADPDGHEMLRQTRTLLPVGDLDVRGPRTRA